MLIGNVDMPPDMQQHIAVMSAILLVIGEILRRLKKKNRVKLVLTIDDMDENSHDCLQNTNLSEADGLKMDSNEPKKQPTQQQKKQ